MPLIPVDEARARILSLLNPLAPEEVQIEDAIGRSVTAPIHARRTLPPWDNSAMDGYAVIAGDGATPLKIIERIFAGDTPRQRIVAGTCARIMTGAPLPPGADAVVMQEKTRALEGDRVELLEHPDAGANIRRRGEDIEQGALLFSEGKELSIGDAGALWGQGLERVQVRRRPRVAIVSSGDELCDVGALREGKIVDTNSPVLAALVRRAGGLPTRIGRAADRLDSLTSLFAQGLEHDVLITLAGASVGEKDFTREALMGLGVDLDFWKVAMKPGKPLAFGRKGETLIFGLPGNPLSAMVTFEIFVRPALRAMQGLPALIPRLPARLGAPIAKQPGLRLFVRATWEVRGDTLWATPLKSQSSGSLSSASGATCLIELGEDAGNVETGNNCAVLPVSWAPA
ncbi:MAG: molybdopterin molybdotransferase MoeA [Archangium sp.]|nr:molybdopterin molybdotransferase MoeA [Archangium sp.]MDP3571869.1 molybdopterin molybdotransferase MoeA [Archangium sp.]